MTPARSLSSRDAERLLRFVAEAGEIGDDQPFTGEFLARVGTLVDADWIGYSELDYVRRRPVLEVERTGDGYDVPFPDPLFWGAVAETHPARVAQARGYLGALKISDFLTRRELRRSPLHEWLSLFGVVHSMDMQLPSDGGPTSGFHFDRFGGRDFTERDRLVLDLLLPHLTRIRRHARKRASLRRRGTKDLTRRESEVVAYVAEGKTNRQIAELLSVAPSTIRKHLENVYAKLGVSTRTAAAARFLGASDAASP